MGSPILLPPPSQGSGTWSWTTLTAISRMRWQKVLESCSVPNRNNANGNTAIRSLQRRQKIAAVSSTSTCMAKQVGWDVGLAADAFPRLGNLLVYPGQPARVLDALYRQGWQASPAPVLFQHPAGFVESCPRSRERQPAVGHEKPQSAFRVPGCGATGWRAEKQCREQP